MGLNTTGRQVAALVVVSLLLAHFLFFFAAMVSISRAPDSFRTLDRGPALSAIARLYAAERDARPAIRSAAARTGIELTEIGGEEASLCRGTPTLLTLLQFLPSPDGEFDFTHCDPTGPSIYAGIIKVDDAIWLGVQPEPGSPAILGHPPFPRARLAEILLLIALPTLMISLWASRLVTAPLKRLAHMADTIDVEQKSANLPLEGSQEIRGLAESFNRLIARLRRFVTDQRRMIAGISHDLRTPLTRLRLRADQIPDPALRQKMLQDIETMAILIDSSLSLVSAQENTFLKSPLDLAVLLATIADEFTDSGHQVTYTGPNHLNFNCEKSMIMRAIENLVDNAIKFAGSAEIRLTNDPQSLTIEVIDHGPGVSEADKQSIFEPFFRGDPSRSSDTPGHGLGLSITRAVIQSHAGAITLHDTQPTGLCVRMRFAVP